MPELHGNFNVRFRAYRSYEVCVYLGTCFNKIASLFFLVFKGNAMGYVRMIRSGGLHCCSSAIRYFHKYFIFLFAHSLPLALYFC